MASLERRVPDVFRDAGLPRGHLLTATGARLLAQEIAALRAQKEGESAQRLREAGRAGSLGDEDEDHAIEDDETVLDARTVPLRELLRRATVVDDPHGEDGRIGLGSLAVV